MPDTFSADAGQRIDPDGRVSYDFQGHISAQGIDLLAAGPGSIPDDRKIRWTQESDGALVAQVTAYTQPGFESGLILAAPSVAGVAKNTVSVTAGGVSRTLLDSGGNSEYVRQLSLGKLAFEGAYQVDSGPLNPGDGATADLTHNLARSDAVPLLAPQNVFLGHDVEWTYAVLNPNTLRFFFRARPDALGLSQVILTGVLATFT